MSTIAHGPVLAASALANPNLSLHATAKAGVPTLPAGFPARLPDELAWTGSQYSRTSDHIFVLDDVHHAELKAALESYKCKHPPPPPNTQPPVTIPYRLCLLTCSTALGQDGDLVEPTNFPLPTLGPKLKELSGDVHSGKGFCVIRGIDPATYSVEDLTLAYLGVQSYIAEQRGRQDKRGNMLGQWLPSLCCNWAPR
jgi:hypothetical protein